MPPTKSASSSPDSSLDLNLPVPDEPLPRHHDLPLDWVYALNEEYARRVAADPAYYEQHLAGKSREPFVM